MIEPVGTLVHPLPRDVKKIAAVIAAAMLDDPLQSHYFPRREQRQEISCALFQLLVTYGIRQGNLLSTSTQYEGLAYWQTPSDRPWQGAAGILWGGLRLFAKAGASAVQRMYTASVFGYRLRKRLVPGPHWYLGLLAVAPGHQGRGHASALMRPVLEKVKRQNLPCYLETHKQINVSMYEHFGFRVVEQIEVPDSGILQWCMVKEGGSLVSPAQS
jgi:ribosomal protein S18 acetylase RimI-like enzyme